MALCVWYGEVDGMSMAVCVWYGEVDGMEHGSVCMVW